MVIVRFLQLSYECFLVANTLFIPPFLSVPPKAIIGKNKKAFQ